MYATRSPVDANEIVADLLAYGANPDIQAKDGNTALTFAARTSGLNNVKLLLEGKADPNKGSPSPLIRAIKEDAPAVVQALLAAGADTRATLDGMTALDFARKYKRSSIIPLLEEAGEN